MSLLSVIIINYNTFDLTCRCISSIYNFTKGVSFEIVLVDNASSECDANLFLDKFPDINLVVSPINAGFAKGNNLGIRRSKGDVILLLNSDTELIEDSLSYCYDRLNAVKHDTVLSCKLIYPNQAVQHQCNRFPSIKLNLIELFRIHKLYDKHKRGKLMLASYFDHEEMIEPEWFWGTFFMFNKALLNMLPQKQLDECFFMYGEDMKWCYDFNQLKVKLLYLPQTKIIHHVGSSSTLQSRINYITKNELEFLRLTKGRLYEIFYALVRSLNLLSTFTGSGIKNAFSLLQNL